MKKILFLAFALVLAVGMSAAAADISWSGEVETEAQWGIGDSDDQEVFGIGVDLDLDVAVDEWNSLYFESSFSEFDGEYFLELGEAALESNLGGWIGDFTGAPLPFGLSYKVGWFEQEAADIADVSTHGIENLQTGDFTEVGHQFSMTFVDMVNVYVGHGFDAGEEDIAPTIFGLDAMIPIEGVGDLGLELVYLVPDKDMEFGDGNFGVGTYFGMPIIPGELDGMLAASYTMFGDADVDWAWGLGAAVSYLDGLVAADFSLGGDEDDALDILGLGLSSQPVNFLKLEAGLGIALEDDNYGGETMNSADVSLTFMPGAASFTLGYFWINDDILGLDGTTDMAFGDVNAVDSSFTGLYFSAGLEY